MGQDDSESSHIPSRKEVLCAVIRHTPQEIQRHFLVIVFLKHKASQLPAHGASGFHTVSSEFFTLHLMEYAQGALHV